MKKVNALVLGLAVLLAFGCEGDENKKKDPAPENDTQVHCKLSKHIRSVNSSQSASEFIFDNAGKLVRVNYTSPVSPGSNSYEVITYNADGNIATVENIVNGGSKVYSYNSNGQPDTIYHLNGSVKTGFKTFEYNAAKQLIKWSSFSIHDTAPLSYSEITYPAANSSKEMRYRRNTAGTPVLESITENLYDDKKHPYSPLGYFFEQVIFSKHNLLSSIITYQGQSYTNTQIYSYDYNAAGYPIKETEVQNGGSPTIDTFSYNCQ